jgi:N-ethylmaleimide reductase
MHDNSAVTLFTPFQMGPIKLSHRVVMAPLTRSRSQQPGDVPGELMKTYYGQRASEGGLIITEATTISITGRGWYGAPGMYSDEQVRGWKKVTDAVHAKGGKIFSQLWHVGRSSNTIMTGGASPVSPSANPQYWINAKASISTPEGWVKASPHRALETSEIREIVDDYRRAAERAQRAGFDGVELHAANGYLPDQFLQDGCNKRTDSYGGSITNRCRFLLEVVEAMASVWGEDRIAVRIGPAGRWNGVSDSDPTALFDHLARELNRMRLAYLHVIEPRIGGFELVAEGQAPVAAEHLRKIFTGTLIAAGGFEPDSGEAIIANGNADLVAFGRHFIANPDLPERIKVGAPLSKSDRATFYTFDAHGYTDYPTFSESSLSSEQTRVRAKRDDLLEFAVDAHGGLDRWSKINAIRIAGSITGAIWKIKGKPDHLANIVMTIETKAQRLSTDFPGQNKRSIFEPNRIVVQRFDGTTIEARDNPKDSFAGQQRETPWDEIHVAYFQGEALWTYFNTPFLYVQPGFASEEIEPIEVDGESWRRLKVTFPDRIKSHTRQQISCFGPDGLLRRHDYTVDILVGATGLNYAFDYRRIGGIMFPMRRRVYAYEGDYQLVKEPLLVGIDVKDIATI